MSVISLLVLFIFTGISLWLGTVLELGLVVISIITGIAYLYFCVKYPKFWLYSIAATSFIFIQPGGEDITVFEVLHGFFFSLSAVFWIFWMIFIKKEKVVRNIADWLILFFFGYLLISLPIAMINGNTLINWGREYIIFSVVLLYFPIRHYFYNKKDITILLIIFTCVLSLSELFQLYQYKQTALHDAIYAYQLGSSVRVNQSIFSMSIIFGFLFSLYLDNVWKRILVLIFTSLSIMALTVSFSRTFWIMVIVALIISLLFVSTKAKKRAFLSLLIIFSVLACSVVFVFRDNARIMFKVLENRVSSAGKGTKDLSIQMRLQEYESVWQSIAKYPLGGRGLGILHEYIQPADLVTIRTLNVHNGYLFFLFRIGYPLFALFLFFIFYYIFKAGLLLFKIKDTFHKLLLLGSLNSLILMIVANFLTIVFNSRDGTFVILLSVVFISISERALTASEQNNNEIIQINSNR